MIRNFPDYSEITLDLREVLNPIFKSLYDGISEFTFANIYLFRMFHSYRISRLNGELYVITGKDDVNEPEKATESDDTRIKGGETGFFMLPFGLPEKDVLDEMFKTCL